MTMLTVLNVSRWCQMSPLTLTQVLIYIFCWSQNTQEQCCVCKQKIVGDCVVNNKTFYHPGCMKVGRPQPQPQPQLTWLTFQCYVCEEPLRNAYLFFQNKPICEKHFKEAQGSCCVCGNVIEGTYYQLNDKIYCHEDYMAHMGDTCAKCSSSIEGEHVKITGSSFHPQCFNCEVRGSLWGVMCEVGHNHCVSLPGLW